MSKWYLVEVKQTKEYLIEVEDDEGYEQAEDVVTNDLLDDFDEINTYEVTSDIDTYLRHVDKDKMFSLE